MNSKRILKIAGTVVVAIILLYSFLPSGLSYQDEIAQHRADTNDFMKNHSDSPLPDSAKANFSGLNFFDPDPEYKVQATLETIPGNPEITMATSDGETRKYRKFAYAYFELGGGENRLTLLQPVDDKETLFLPFGDLTNGEETYGGGRYLDLTATDQRSITIDFNLAYNPYCVFSADYSCPLPPVENQLSIEIRAGERNF